MYIFTKTGNNKLNRYMNTYVDFPMPFNNNSKIKTINLYLPWQILIPNSHYINNFRRVISLSFEIGTKQGHGT